MIVSLIAAMAKNRVIGKSNDLPWNIPQDLRYFKDKTRDHIIIMGRKTLDSRGGKPLPKRFNIIVTRNKDYEADGVKVCNSVEEALEVAQELTSSWKNEVFVCGGSEIYNQTLDKADKLYLTHIEKEYDGDTFFPEVDWEKFKEVSRETYTEPEKFSFVVYERI